jgi:hypothetical protein
VAIPWVKFQIPKSKSQANPFKMQNVKIKVQNNRATVNKKLKCKKQRCQEEGVAFLIFEFLYCSPVEEEDITGNER